MGLSEGGPIFSIIENIVFYYTETLWGITLRQQRKCCYRNPPQAENLADKILYCIRTVFGYQAFPVSRIAF